MPVIFTPQQEKVILDKKGLQHGSRGAAMELARQAIRYDNLLKKHAGKFQEGGMPGRGINYAGMPTPEIDPAVLDKLNNPPSTPESTKAGLNAAQARVADAELKLANLTQQLADLSTDAESDAQRELLTKQINEQRAVIAQAQANLASSSTAFGTVSVPTAAETVGMGMSTPSDLVTETAVNQIQYDPNQEIAAGTGEVGDAPDLTAQQATAGQSDAPTITDANLATTSTTAEGVSDALENLAPASGTPSADAIAGAAQQDLEDLGVFDLEGAKYGETVSTQDVKVKDMPERLLKEGELVKNIHNAENAATFVNGFEAATGSPSTAATVQGQYTKMMADFETGKNPPAYAAGAMRQAVATMAQRGMVASSMGAAAIMNAAMESVMPIALADANIQKEFELQNLTNRQATATLQAKFRADFLGKQWDEEAKFAVQNAAKITDIANMNYSSGVQVALENAGLTQTANLANMKSFDAVIAAQAASVSMIDKANLDNRQQTELANANAFLQMDFSNLSNEQQATMFKAQSVVQSLFTDAAAENATSQFNASSENQVQQFFSNLSTMNNQFNAAQQSAISQFNAGEGNSMEQFQETMQNMREQFDAQNQLIIAQAATQWRQQLTTVNNAEQNEANRQDAMQANGYTTKAMDEIWQKERDLMHYAFAAAETAAERYQRLIEAELGAEAEADSAFSTGLAMFGSALIGGLFEGGANSVMSKWF